MCVVEDLVPYLPGHAAGGVASNGVGAVSAAPLGNAAVLPISWMYCRMMGAEGLQAATEIAILQRQLHQRAPGATTTPRCTPARTAMWRTSASSTCARSRTASGVTAEDVAKRLIDYGFHAPTLSFPVPGTLMVEPTESEPLAELDRFIDAMIAIRGEIRRVEEGVWPKDDNPLKHAPHTAASLLGSEWTHPYSRELAAFPLRRRSSRPSTGRRSAASTTSTAVFQTLAPSWVRQGTRIEGASRSSSLLGHRRHRARP